MSQNTFTQGPQGAKHASAKGSFFKKELTLKLSFPGIAGLCIVTLLGFAWIFAFGVIVGRGFEEKLPALNKMLSGPDHTITAPHADEIIKAEDLTFHAELKDTPPAKPAQNVPVQQAIAKSGSSSVPIDQPSSQPDKTQQTTAVQAAAEKNAGTTVQKDYVLQLIAYKSSEQADTFREKLEGDGLRTRLFREKDAKGKTVWYKVQVQLRGTEADLTALQGKLNKYGIKKPLVISSKVVSKR